DAMDQMSAVSAVTWARAIDYCEWLDGLEGLTDQACYARQGDRLASPRPFPDLAKTGYRLPTRAEWRFASLAGASTRRHYGDDDDDHLIGSYAWFQHRKARSLLHPVGQLMPNDFGLFDVYGNVAEWNADIDQDGNQVTISGGSYHSVPDRCNSLNQGLTR